MKVLISLSVFLFLGQTYLLGSSQASWEWGVFSSWEKVFNDSSLQQKSSATISLKTCRNEMESFQVAFRPSELKTLNWEVKGDLPEDWVSFSKVLWVDIPKERSLKFEWPSPRSRVGLWPDPLIPISSKRLDFEAQAMECLWVDIDTPSNAKPGRYHSRIEFSGSKGALFPVELDVIVWNTVLPDRFAFKTSYWYEDRFFRSYFLELPIPSMDQNGKDMMWGLVRPYLKLLLDRHITPVFNMWPESIIIARYNEGLWQFDTSEMERRLSYILEREGRKGNTVNILEAHMSIPNDIVVAEGDAWVKVKMVPGTDFMKDYVNSYLIAWQELLERRDWLKYAYAGISDEVDKRKMLGARWLAGLVKKKIPKLPLLTTMGMYSSPVLRSGKCAFLDIMVPNMTHHYWDNRVYYQNAVNEGVTLWGYVNSQSSLITTEILDQRVLFWSLWKYGMQGSLYWSVNCWNYDKRGKYPNSSAMSLSSPIGRWPRGVWRQGVFGSGDPGDGYLLYPSPTGEAWSSIRLEAVRDGVEDWEMFSILRQKINTLPSKERLDLMEVSGISQDLIKSPLSYARKTSRFEERRHQLGDLLSRLNQL